MLDKYITIKDKTIIAKQTSSGRWICDQLPAETTKELEILIGEVNCILNKYNTESKEPLREHKDTIRGLKP